MYTQYCTHPIPNPRTRPDIVVYTVYTLTNAKSHTSWTGKVCTQSLWVYCSLTPIQQTQTEKSPHDTNEHSPTQKLVLAHTLNNR